MDLEQNKQKIGVIYAFSAYLIWGILPIYWKLLNASPPDEVLAHRIIWAFVFMLVVIFITRQWTTFINELKRVILDRKKWMSITAASFMISFNWLLFIWTVQNDHVVQASLGYYINPLVSVLLGVIFLKERLSHAQTISLILATVGVIYLTINYGVFPWIALILAFSFGFYGLLKKTVDVNSIFSLTIETMIVTPLALIYLLIFSKQALYLHQLPIATIGLLIGSGIVTAIPLLLFGIAVKYISLSLIGFLQYIAPTLMLIFGVFLYGEPFTQAHLFSFFFIWIALIIFMFSTFQPAKKQKQLEKNMAKK